MKTEPTAWLSKERDLITFDNLFPEMTPLYEKREWVGLTDEEVDALHMEVKVRLMGTFDTKDIYRAIEVKLKEKNT